MFQTAQLNNGIKLVYTPANDSAITYCALMILSGTRDENKNHEGIAHFLEHCIFKGTKKRKAIQVISTLDAVGGELNAYTSKEETCVYTTFQNSYLDKAMDLMSDIVFRSQFPAEEIKKEKGVVIDEIHSYLDSPSELIFDEFEERLFKGNSIGHSVLGNVNSVSAFKSSDLKSFVKENYLTSRMVLSVSSALSFEMILKKAEKYFGIIKSQHRNYNRIAPKNKNIFQEVEEKETFQCHSVMGGYAPGYHHKNRLAFVLLNNIIGGNALNSRLNIALREKNGYAYSVESVYTPFTDSGSFSIYFGTDKKNYSKCVKLVNRELAKLREEKLTEKQLNAYKKQLKGQLALSEENRANRVMGRAKTFGIFNRLYAYHEICERIDALTNDQLLQTAQTFYSPEKLSGLTYYSQS